MEQGNRDAYTEHITAKEQIDAQSLMTKGLKLFNAITDDPSRPLSGNLINGKKVSLYRGDTTLQVGDRDHVDGSIDIKGKFIQATIVNKNGISETLKITLSKDGGGVYLEKNNGKAVLLDMQECDDVFNRMDKIVNELNSLKKLQHNKDVKTMIDTLAQNEQSSADEILNQIA